MAQFPNTIGSLPIQPGLPAGWTQQTGQVNVSVIANTETQYSDRAIAFSDLVSPATITWNAPGVLGDSEVLALIKPTGSAVGALYYYSAAIRVQASVESGYYFGFMPTSTTGGANVRLANLLNGNTLALATASFAWSTETWYWVRLRAIGSAISAKIWPMGAAEPVSPQLSATDSQFTTGRLGLRCRTNSISSVTANFWGASAGDVATRASATLLSASAVLALSSTFLLSPAGQIWGVNKTSLNLSSDWNARFVSQPIQITAVIAAAALFKVREWVPTRWTAEWVPPLQSTLKADAFIPYKTLPRHYEGDSYRRRFAPDYNAAFNDLLPTGPAWPREPATTFQKTVAGLSAIWGTTVEKLAELLLTRESDPRSTVVLLPDWERAWGLPDKCIAEPLTIQDRQIALVHKMTLLGAQSREFFVRIAAEIGYHINIREWAPFMCGISMCGDTRGFDLVSTSLSTQATTAKLNNRVWIPNGAAQIDNAQAKFGTGSLLLNPATVDMISTPNHPDWSLTGQNFTIQGFFICNQVPNLNHRAIIGQNGANLSDLSGRAFSISRTPSVGDTVANVIKAEIWTNNGQQAIFGTTVFTNVLNTGWHHYRFVRFLNTIYLFIDGIMEGFLVMPAGTVVNTVEQPLAIGGFGAPSGATSLNTWGGRLDAVQYEVGIARSTSSFTPPSDPIKDVPVATDYTRALLNFEGPNSSKVFMDESLSVPSGVTVTTQVDVDTNEEERLRGHYRWEIGRPEMRFFWAVTVGAVRFTWFRASVGQAGIDHHLEFALATDLECILRRWKPAHTEIIFDYSPMIALDFSQTFDSGFFVMMF